MENPMTVGNPENFKVKLISSGREEVDKRIPCDLSNLTLDKLFKWIDSQQISGIIKQELKKSASRFPQQTLGVWQRNYTKHLSRAQTKVRNKKSVTKIEEIVEKDTVNNKAPSEDPFEDNFEDNV